MTDHPSASAPGKIILSGEYAVVFGGRGIAIPSKEKVTVSWAEDATSTRVNVVWKNSEAGMEWMKYTHNILSEIEKERGPLKGRLTIESTVPLGKGMGSSTALVVALCRCLLGEMSAKVAVRIENFVNPGNSGLDFAVIWTGKPLLYKQGVVPEEIDFDMSQLKDAKLIDTGSPNEPTPMLVEWVRKRNDDECRQAIEMIGNCTERLLKGEPLKDVMRDHARAQILLGVVPASARKVIEEVEANGGSAKVLGAGARTGGGGMVLVLP